MNTTVDIVISLLSEIISVPENELNGQTPFTPEYDIEPIDIAKLVIEIEKRFEVVIHDEIVHTLKTPDDMADYVDFLMSEL